MIYIAAEKDTIDKKFSQIPLLIDKRITGLTGRS